MLNKIICENEEDLIKQLSSVIEKIAQESISKNGIFNVGFSGGSLVKFLSLGLPTIKTDYSKWKIYFCDERVVSEDSPDSTFGVYKKDLLSKVPIPEDRFVRIKQGVSAQEAAEDYISKMSVALCLAMPRFDLLLLGMGPDGHTCSLFPNHPVLEEDTQWVMPVTDSPKPPPNRITLTFPVINNARNCVFAMAGEGKAEMVKRILSDKEDLPAARVQPKHGDLYWILDKSAAILLE